MASIRRIRRNACTGKQRHQTKQGAVAHAKAHERSFGFGMRAYSCKFCKAYHVGHPKYS